MIYYTIREILNHTDGKILIIVPNINLVIQMGSDFKNYGWDCNDLTLLCAELKKDVDFSKRVLISTYQSLLTKEHDFFEDFNTVIIDEVHLAKEEKFLTEILKASINAKYVLGYTRFITTI
jgi:superfamily II DNA or RNA helicase